MLAHQRCLPGVGPRAFGAVAFGCELVFLAPMQDVSKFLSYLLRHRPEAIGLTLDHGGWAQIDDILERTDRPITREMIETAVRDNDKQRFALSSDGTRIRARQGHSIPVDLDLAPAIPPDVLFHGTAEKSVASIMAEGLKPGTRNHVHLSKDRDTARKVGMRHGRPVILTVDARALAESGHAFYLSENGVWLCSLIAATFLEPHWTA